jgi:hypothetical protein
LPKQEDMGVLMLMSRVPVEELIKPEEIETDIIILKACCKVVE